MTPVKVMPEVSPFDSGHDIGMHRCLSLSAEIVSDALEVCVQLGRASDRQRRVQNTRCESGLPSTNRYSHITGFDSNGWFPVHESTVAVSQLRPIGY